MKSVIPIDETWTVTSFRNTTEGANDILSENGLPYANNPMAPIYIQQQEQIRDTTSWSANIHEGSWINIDNLEQNQIAAVKGNLDDYDKAYAIAMLDTQEWRDYALSGAIAGYLQVPEPRVTERTSVSEGIRNKILGSGSIQIIRELLAPRGEVDIVPGSQAKSVVDTDWFWKPTGEVMFSLEGQEPIEIPCWPEAVRDSTSASWSQEMTTYQHYEPKNTYKGSGPRVVSCTFKIHRAMWDGNQDSGFAETLLAYLQSACYPDYETQAAEPPKCMLVIGNSIRIRGIMTSCENTFEGPIGPDTKYDCVSISISITEVSDNVLSTSAVRGGLANWR